MKKYLKTRHHASFFDVISSSFSHDCSDRLKFVNHEVFASGSRKGKPSCPVATCQGGSD